MILFHVYLITVIFAEICHGDLETAFISGIWTLHVLQWALWGKILWLPVGLPGLLLNNVTRRVCSGLYFWLPGRFTWHGRECQDSALPRWPGNPTRLGSSAAENFQVLRICTEGGLRKALSGVQEVARLSCRRSLHSNAGSNQHTIYLLRQLFMSMPHW